MANSSSETRVATHTSPGRTTISKANAVLEALVRLAHPASLGDIAEVLPFPKPTLRRLLIQLIDAGVVEQHPDDRRYRLGLRLVSLAAAVLDGLETRRVSIPLLHQLMSATGESTYLAILDGPFVIYIDVVEGPNLVNLTTKVGTRHTAHDTATGKILLAYLDAEERDTLLALSNVDEPRQRKLKIQLGEIREAGVAVIYDERSSGISSVAAPIFDRSGSCVAALAVAMPTYRFSDKLKEDIAIKTREVAALFTESLADSLAARRTMSRNRGLPRGRTRPAAST